MNKTVSFDFDGVLDQLEVQKYASELLKRGIDVIICTARFNDLGDNWDIDSVKEQLGIKRVIYCGSTPKYFYLNNLKPIWHLDDCDFEIEDLEIEAEYTKPIQYPKGDWKKECEDLINA